MFNRREVLLAGLAACVRRGWTATPRPLPDTFQRGMNLAHLHRRGWGYGSARAEAQVAALAALGVRDVALNPFGYTPSLQSSEIRWEGDDSLTDADLRAQVAQLHAAGMRVMMKPHLWTGAFWSGKGNGDIALDRDGWRRWFDAYTAFVVHYATLAQQTGCARLCVGLEYTSATLHNPGAWAAVARACREVYSGELLYAANWYEEFQVFQDWDAFDLIGVNAYFPLEGDSVDALVQSWQLHLDAIEAVSRGKPVIFPEAGYRAISNALARPWESTPGANDPAVQALGYEALLRAATARSWFGGVYWWKWFTDLPGEHDPYCPAGLPAQGVIKAWFQPSVGSSSKTPS